MGVRTKKLNVDDWYSHSEIPPRKEWSASSVNPRVGYTGRWQLKSAKDYKKCPDCGGTGWKWEQRNHGKKRLKKCVCKYAT